MRVVPEEADMTGWMRGRPREHRESEGQREVGVEAGERGRPPDYRIPVLYEA